MKSAVLNTTQLAFLEELMLRFGKVVTYEQLAPLVPTRDAVAKRQFVSRLAVAGWLVRIKKGVYQVADISSLGTLTLSRYALAQILAPGSYVSFEAALQFHGMHDHQRPPHPAPRCCFGGVSLSFCEDKREILLWL